MSPRRRLEQGSLFALSLLPLMMAASGAVAQALPSGGTIGAGSATITATSPTLVTIDQSTTKAIINWTDFSIGAGNGVQFNNGSGATLNRVTGASISNLDGALNATGSVYLINPNGVIIGSGGVVNVGGTFVASSLNITDANFLAGKGLTFEGVSTASVVNLGQIGALGGDVALIAKTVNNEGAITAANGSAGLLAGSKVLIRDAMADDGKFVVQVGGAGADVSNIGAINAAVAELRTNGGNVYALAGNIGSGVTATSVSNVGGRVFLTAGANGLVASTGVVTASKSVEMSGDVVSLAGDGDITQVSTSKWLIDASEFTIDTDEAAAINTAAGNGANIEVRTHAGSGSGFINVNAELDLLNSTLTLSAALNLVVNTQISGTGDKILRADNAGTGVGDVVLDATLEGGRYDIYTNASDYSDYTPIRAFNETYADSSLVVTHLLVNSYADLVRMRTDNGGDIYGAFALGRDIDAGASIDGQYVGVAFQGQFDGLGHTISNLHVTGASAGLFTELNGGNVSNLNLTGSVEGTDYAGAVAGHGYMSSITNVTSSMSVTNTGASTGNNGTGGLLGYGTYVSIDGSSATGAVSGTGDVGGLIGRTNDVVRNSFATGAVSGTADNVGGLVGRADGYLISDSFATGSVNGGSGSVGGLVGFAVGTTFTNVHATGAVHADWSAGGLVGAMYNGSIDTAWASGDVSLIHSNGGGLVGLIYGTNGAPDIEIRHAYATGSVTGTGYVGGLIGQIDGNGTYTNYLIDDVHATGNVNATDLWSGFAGGLFGVVGQQAFATVSNFYATGSATGGFAGGIAGLMNQGSTYSDGYASGAVSGGYQGGLFGYQNSGTVSVTNLYWDTETTGQADAGGNLAGSFTGLTTANAVKPAGQASPYTFTDPSKWVLSIDGLRPMLASEYSTTITNVHQLQLIALDGAANYTIGSDFSAAETAQAGGVFGTGGFSTVNYLDGALSGGGHQISGLTMHSDNFASMFGNLNGSIDDLALVGGDFTGPLQGGTFAAYLNGSLTNVSSSVNLNVADNTGGLVFTVGGTGVIRQSAFTGTVTTANYAGYASGIAARNFGLIEDSRTTGTLNAQHYTAGVVAENQGVIHNVLSVGAQNGALNAIVALNNYGSVDNVVWDSEATHASPDHGADNGTTTNVRGYTTAQLQEPGSASSVYAGFDLNNVWAVGSGAGQSSDGLAHYAELYRTDNVRVVDAGSNYTSVYGDAIIALNDSATVRGDVRPGDAVSATGPATTAVQGSDVGTYGITYGSVTRNGGGVYRTVSLNTYEITKRQLTAALTGTVTKTYDQTDMAVFHTNNFNLTGVLYGDDVIVVTTAGTYADVNAGSGKTVSSTSLALGGAKSGNYFVSGGVTGAVGQIDKATVSAGYDGVITKTYDRTTGVTIAGNLFTLAGVYAGDELGVNAASGVYNSSQVLDANSVTASGLVLSGGSTSNYQLASTTVTLDGAITPATLSATLTGTFVKTYDGTNTADLSAANLSGLTGAFAGDHVSLASATGTYSTANAGTGLTVTAQGVLTGADASNYVLSDATAAGQINARVLTAGFSSTPNKTYDGSNEMELGWSDFNLSNVVNGDDVGIDWTVGNFNSAKVLLANSFTVNGLALAGESSGNYVLASNTLTAAGSIDPRMVYGSLTGTVTKQYDGTDVAHLTDENYSLSNAIEGDDLKVSGPTTGYYASKDNNEGSPFAMTVTVEGPLSLSGADASNYVVYDNGGDDDFAARPGASPGIVARPTANTMSGKIGRINRRELTAIIGGASTKTYDGTTGIGLGNLTVSADIVEGEDVQVSADLESAAYADKNAGTHKAVVAGGATLGGDDAFNYVLVSTTASGAIGTIDAKTISAGLTGSTVKTYDGATTANLGAGNYVLSGLIGEDVVTVAGSANYADKNAGTGKTITVNGLTLSGAAGGNYVLASNTASAAIGTINVKALTAGLTGAVVKTYDGSTSATLTGANYGLTGVVDGETIAVASTGAAYGDKNAGAGKTVTVTGLTLSGAGVGNYVLTSTTASAAIGKIDAKALTAGLTGTVIKTYDGSTAATLTGANYGLTGVIGDETVTVASTGAAYGDKNVGAGKTVTASGVSLGGADSGNYVLTSTTASAAIGKIDAKTLTAGLTGSTTKVYDGATTATLTGANYGLTGVVGGESVTLASTGATYADKNAGTGKTVTASGFTIGGGDAGNYVLASTSASGSIGAITPRGLTITAEDKTKNRNDLDPALTYTAGAMVTGDSLTGALTREVGESVGAYGIRQGTLNAGGNYAVTFNPAVFTIALGIPPVENLVIPYLPAEGGGAGDQDAGGQDTAPTSVGYQLAQEDAAPKAQDDKDDTATCAANDTCQTAPYAQGGSTSGAIHFQGYMH